MILLAALLHGIIGMNITAETTLEDAISGKACQGLQHSRPRRHNNAFFDQQNPPNTEYTMLGISSVAPSPCTKRSMLDITIRRLASRVVILSIHVHAFCGT
jgi:hypothetical protein